MNAKETKAIMDRSVKIRKLLAKLDRELFGLRNTLSALQQAVHNDSTVECTIELSEDSWNEAAPEEPPTYIYERNPDSGQVYRREFGDYDTPREKVDDPCYSKLKYTKNLVLPE